AKVPAGGRADGPPARQQRRRALTRRHRVRVARPCPAARGPGAAGRPRRAEKRGDQGASTNCPPRRDPPKCVGFRPKALLTLMGDVRLERHYYHCRQCRQGFCPWDGVLRLSAAALSPAADEVVCLAGVQVSFATASRRNLAKMAGLRVSE